MDPQSASLRAAEQSIGRLTLWLGAGAALAVGALLSVPAGFGVAIGAGLAWLNHRWLGQSLDAVTHAVTAQPGGPSPRVPSWTYFKFVARYGLIGLVLYVMFSRLGVPLLSLLGGFFALGAAAMVQGIREAVSRPR